jgi:hypothetical protein
MVSPTDFAEDADKMITMKLHKIRGFRLQRQPKTCGTIDSLLKAALRWFFVLPTLLMPLAHAEPRWQVSGASGLGKVLGRAGDAMATVTLEVPAPGVDAALRFGPISVSPSAREINVQAEMIASIPQGKSFRFTLTLTSEAVFPERKEQILARGNFSIVGEENGIIGFTTALPRSHAPGRPLNAFLELSSRHLERSGKLGPPASGKVSLRNTSLLTSGLAASHSAAARRRSYLAYAGRATGRETDERLSNRSALLLPGLLASIVDVKDPADPRLTRFMAETRRTLDLMRANKTRTGPFEIYLPIANHASAKRILGSTLTDHPAYKEYEKTIFDHQRTWSDYKSTGFGPPRNPIREAKTIADVPTDIDNGNFRLLVSAAGYLSAQEFAGFQTNYKDIRSGVERVITRDVIMREMELYIRRTYHSIAARNTSEYGAQTYLALDFSPIHLIAECAKDPEIKRIAARTLDWLYTSLAASWNQGHYINSAARSKGEFLGTGSAIGFIGWLVFDTGKSAEGNTIPFSVYCALPGVYQLPPAVRPLTNYPFVKREKIGEGGNIVGVYAYQTQSFGMTCSFESRNANKRQDPKWDRDSFYKEAGRHKLNWFGAESGGFSPQWENSAQPYADRRNQRNGRNYGLNPWSYVSQYRGTQIGLADVREGYPFRQLYCVYPLHSLRARVVKAASGWTLCHTGRVVFAFRALKRATKADDPWPDRSSLTDWYDYKKTAWILEVSEAPKTAGVKTDAMIADELERFHRTLLRAQIEVAHLDDADKEAPTLSYTSPVSGKTLKLDAAVYPILADGEGVAINDYPVLATYPDQVAAPRILQQKDRLLWLDAKGKSTFGIGFTDWLR